MRLPNDWELLRSHRIKSKKGGGVSKLSTDFRVFADRQLDSLLYQVVKTMCRYCTRKALTSFVGKREVLEGDPFERYVSKEESRARDASSRIFAIRGTKKIRQDRAENGFHGREGERFFFPSCRVCVGRKWTSVYWAKELKGVFVACACDVWYVIIV